MTTGGALANAAKVNSGKADLGLTMAKLYGEAMSSTGAYEGKPKMENLRGIAFLAYIPMSYFLVKADNPISSIEEIKEKTAAHPHTDVQKGVFTFPCGRNHAGRIRNYV